MTMRGAKSKYSSVWWSAPWAHSLQVEESREAPDHDIGEGARVLALEIASSHFKACGHGSILAAGELLKGAN